MVNGNPSRIDRRKLPGVDREVSILTVSIDPPMAAPASTDARTVQELRNARARGVTTFDVAAARFPARAERLIAAAFPSPDPDVTAIVGRAVDSLAQERDRRGDSARPSDFPGALEESLEQSRRRLAPVPISVLEWSSPPVATPGGTTEEPADFPTGSGSKGAVRALRLSPRAVALPEGDSASGLFSAGFSLLEREVALLFEGANERAGARLIARDPFSDGRLDGSRFEAATALSAPGAGPVELRRLQTEFEPVLALGFLTKDRKRTLAQAALHYVLDRPWVVTTVVPLPAPERFEEILGFGASPSLSEEDRSRLGLVK